MIDYLGQNLKHFLEIIIVFFFIVASPGADFATTVRNSLLYSRSGGIFSAAGTSIGMLIHATYTIFGIAILITASPKIFLAIQVLGSLYLLYIAYNCIAKTKGIDVKAFDNLSASKKRSVYLTTFKNGFLVNILNPFAIILFISTMSSMVKTEINALYLLIYLSIIFLVSMSWYTFVATFFAIPHIRKALSNVGHWIDRIAGVIFILLAIRILRSVFFT